MSVLSLLVIEYLVSVPALIVLCMLGIWAEHASNRKTALLIGLGTIYVTYKFIGADVRDIVWYIVGYAAIGMAWSVWRYRRFVSDEVERIVSKWPEVDSHIRISALENLHPKNKTSELVSWILIWPFSFVENAIGDLINAVEVFVKTYARKLYESTYHSLVDGVMGNKK